MMKTKRSIFLALMAAALFFAAGCSDSSDDAWEEESAASSESGTASETVASDDSGTSDSGSSAGSGSTLIEITEDNVAELLQKIGNVTSSDNLGCYWDFANGTLATDGEGYTFAVPWVDNNGPAPARAGTISNLQKKGKVSTSLLTVDLSEADWDEQPSSNLSITTGTIRVNIELAESAAGSYTIPESLQSVTIVLKNSEWLYN